MMSNNNISEETLMKTQMTQKEAVYVAVMAVCAQAGLSTEGRIADHFDPGSENHKELRGQVNNILFEGFTAGNVVYDGNIPEEKKLKSYVSGLQSNWLRKDKRLNGGIQYTAKNPGSRAGSTDPQVKAMRALLATKTDASEKAEIQSFIDKRLAAIKPTTKVEIDVDALPEELRHLA